MGKNRKSPTVPMDEVTTEALAKHLEQGRSYLQQLRKTLPTLVSLSEDERRFSLGKLRKGEAEALTTVLDAADVRPAVFQSLADQDYGFDPEKFETKLVRDRLAKLEMLRAFTEDDVEPFVAELSDTVLRIGDFTRPVVLAAYHIAKTLSKTDKALASAIADAVTYYTRPARKGARTRKKNAKKPPKAP